MHSSPYHKCHLKSNMKLYGKKDKEHHTKVVAKKITAIHLLNKNPAKNKGCPKIISLKIQRTKITNWRVINKQHKT